MCNLYSITTNQAAIMKLFRVINRYVGNLAPMSGVFPDYPAPVVDEAVGGAERRSRGNRDRKPRLGRDQAPFA
jgi:putative SOS response-associated peptidase YedK